MGVNDHLRLSTSVGRPFIEGFEWFVGYVYDDKRPPVKGVYREWKGEPVIGTLTIGFGHTDKGAHPLKIRLGLRVTRAEAEEILDVDLDPCEAAVRRLVKVRLTQGEFDALVSFTFNCGEGALMQLGRRLNAGDRAGARAAFDLYVNSRGAGKTLEFMPGLQRRRDGEQVIFDLVDRGALTARPPIPTPQPRPPAAEISFDPPAPRAPVAVMPIEAFAPSIAPDVLPPMPTEPVHHAAEVEVAGVSGSRTMQGAGITASAGAGVVVDQATELAGQLQQAEWHLNAGTIFGLVVGLIILGGAAYVLYAKWDDAGRPMPRFLPASLKRALA